MIALSLFQSSGLAIGMGLNNTTDVIGSIFLSFAGGTFIYIACSEILAHEFDGPDKIWLKYLKFFVYLLGAAIITVLWLLHEEHDHSGGDEHSEEGVTEDPSHDHHD